MKLCIVGGIFDKDAQYRAVHRETPETTLADGLRAAGVEVRTIGHAAYVPAKDDVVHVHHLGRASVVAVASRGRERVVFTAHDGTLLGDSTKVPLRRALAWRLTAAAADTVVTLSRAESKVVEARVPVERVVCIPNGVSAAAFTDATALSGSDESVSILYVGQLIALKGIDVLMRAFSRVAADHSSVQLLLAYHVATLEPQLRALAQARGVPDRVHFLGPQNSAALARLYRQAACVVLPSFAEALPSVLIEAQLCGAPVVATNVGGIPDIIDDRAALVQPGDDRGLETAIRLALKRRSWDDPVARLARRRLMLERFSVDRMIRDHLACYEQTLARPRRLARFTRALGPVINTVFAASSGHTLHVADPTGLIGGEAE